MNRSIAHLTLALGPLAVALVTWLGCNAEVSVGSDAPPDGGRSGLSTSSRAASTARTTRSNDAGTSGGATGASGLGTTSSGSGSEAPEADAAADARASRAAPTFAPAPDGGGERVTCAPYGGPTLPGARYPGCTFVDEAACTSDGDCGCGCSCQCGICSCSVEGKLSACVGGDCCTTAADCGPSCYGLTCRGGQCVAATAGDWAGTWSGTFSVPGQTYVGVCGKGLAPDGVGGAGSGRYHVVVTEALPHVSVQLVEARASEQPEQDFPLCVLPFIVSNGVATLVPGSTCVLASVGACGDGTVSFDTYTRGTATLAAGVMTLTLDDVWALPFDGTSSGGACAPSGDEVTVSSLTATLERVDAG